MMKKSSDRNCRCSRWRNENWRVYGQWQIDEDIKLLQDALAKDDELLSERLRHLKRILEKMV